MKTKPNYLFSKSILFVFAFMLVSLCGYADEVSVDDATESIFGYADNGVFDYNNMPDNVRWWMDNISRQVRLQNQLQSYN